MGLLWADRFLLPSGARRRFLIAFWLWYAVAAVWFVGMMNTWEAIWPVSLCLVWWLVLFFREPLQRFTAWLRLPLFLKFLLLGLFFNDVVMENLAVSFKGDLHPNLFLNCFLWLGPYAGVLVGWWLLARFYSFSPWLVFLLYGIKGVIIEQDFLVAKLLLSKQFLAVAVFIPIVAVVYGASVAPVFVALEKELPRPPRRLGLLGPVLAIGVPALLFYGFAFVWFKLVALIFGLKIGA
jgi:hypothetical protein